MATLSLREAAQQAGTSKSTILRAIQSGRMSAARNDDGGYAIDPAELFRVYPPRPADHGTNGSDRAAGQGAPGQGSGDIVEIRIRNARLESEGESLRTILEAERRRAEELRYDRDRWAAQAERLAIAAPVRARPNGGIMKWLKRA